VATFTLTINMGNDAMADKYDVARALESLAGELGYRDSGRVVDDNGNTVGTWSFN